jgi:hypothetical protein
MIRKIVLIALPLCAAACNSKPTVDETNASVEEVAEKVREATDDGQLLQPGKWLSKVTIEDVSIAGMPKEAAEQMKRMVAQTHQAESCLTPEQAKQPKGGFFGGNDQCRYDHFTMRGGKIDAQMRCEQGGSTQAMQMTGTYSPDSYEMRMSTSQEQGPGGGPMSLKMKVEAKRVGKCSGAS